MPAVMIAKVPVPNDRASPFVIRVARGCGAFTSKTFVMHSEGVSGCFTVAYKGQGYDGVVSSRCPWTGLASTCRLDVVPAVGPSDPRIPMIDRALCPNTAGDCLCTGDWDMTCVDAGPSGQDILGCHDCRG